MAGVFGLRRNEVPRDVTPARASSRAGVTSPAFYREVYLEGCRATDDPNEYITEIQFSVEKSE
jgi:hypothetical protein